MIWVLTAFSGSIGLLFLGGHLYYVILRLPKLETVTKSSFFVASSLFSFLAYLLFLFCSFGTLSLEALSLNCF